MTGRTLVVTNDFPPRVGGIESFVLAMVERMDPSTVVVHTARQPGDAAFDASLAFPVIRDSSRILLPTPAITRRGAGSVRMPVRAICLRIFHIRGRAPSRRG